MRKPREFIKGIILPQKASKTAKNGEGEGKMAGLIIYIKGGCHIFT
jgi:hypothetical protein